MDFEKIKEKVADLGIDEDRVKEGASKVGEELASGNVVDKIVDNIARC